MERISILERVSYTPLFDWCIGSWKEDTRQPRDASALVQFFYQFARDIQGGSQKTHSNTHTRTHAHAYKERHTHKRLMQVMHT